MATETQIQELTAALSNLSTNVALSDAINSTSSVSDGVAATPLAVKTAKEEAITAAQTAAEEAKSIAQSNSGVTPDTYGPDSNATLSYGGTFIVPYVTVDVRGRTTSAGERTFTMPGAPSVSNISGNAGTATKLQNKRRITIMHSSIFSGTDRGHGYEILPACDYSAYADFDGSSNVTITVPSTVKVYKANCDCDCDCS